MDFSQRYTMKFWLWNYY